MKKQIILTLSLLILITLGQKAKAQNTVKVTTEADTTVYDERTPSGEHEYKIPQFPLSNEDFNHFLHNHYQASNVIQKNRLYTKLEVVMTIEKDGSISKYEAKGTGTQAMRNEIVRILKLLPKYTPGTRDGHPARFRLYQPFEFKYE